MARLEKWLISAPVAIWAAIVLFGLALLAFGGLLIIMAVMMGWPRVSF